MKQPDAGIWGRAPLLLLLALGAFPGAVPAQESAEVTLTNLQVFRCLVSRIGKEVGQVFSPGGPDSVVLSIFPREIGWAVEDTLAAVWKEQGLRVSATPAARYAAECGLSAMRVDYENAHSRGLFGARVCDRTVSLTLRAKVVDKRAGSILASKEYAAAATDTVRISEIERLEDASLPITRGKLPPEGLFASILEPITILGAVAIAVYLLFSVRS